MTHSLGDSRASWSRISQLRTMWQIVWVADARDMDRLAVIEKNIRKFKTGEKVLRGLRKWADEREFGIYGDSAEEQAEGKRYEKELQEDEKITLNLGSIIEKAIKES